MCGEENQNGKVLCRNFKQNCRSAVSRILQTLYKINCCQSHFQPTSIDRTLNILIRKMQSEVHQHIHIMCCLWHDLFTFHLVCRTFDKSLNISEKVTELIFVKSYKKKNLRSTLV